MIGLNFLIFHYETQMATPSYDFIIVGAGVVGPALATNLASKGKTVLMLERDLSEPDRIVGELLQPGGIQLLEKLGLGAALDGIDAAPITGYEVIYEKNSVNIPYPPPPHQTKPAVGKGFHHGRFVMNLRRLSSETEGVTLKQATVTEIIEKDGRIVGVKTKENPEPYYATITCVCDGTNSNFRKQFVQTRPVVKSHFVGTILQNPDLQAPGHGHCIIGSDFSPMLIYSISPTEARILCNVPMATLPSKGNGDLKKWLETNSLPHLPVPLQKSFAKALEDESQLRSMPNQYLPAIQYDVQGLIILGDAMNMRHPLTGGGMTVGFNDAYLLSEALGRLSSDELASHSHLQIILKEFRRHRKGSSVVINVLSIALYLLFAADSPELKILQVGCFEYFKCGGEHIRGPASIISALTPSVSLLFYHFFAVAFFAIRLNFVSKIKESGLLGFFIAFYQMFTTLWTAAGVFLPFLFKELLY